MTLDFFFEMTGTLSAQFSWKIRPGGELEMHLLNSSGKVTSKPLTEGFGRCDPTYLKRLMKELNSSYRSHPDVKKTEKIVGRNLDMLRDCANKVLYIMVSDEGLLFLLDDLLFERVRLKRGRSYLQGPTSLEHICFCGNMDYSGSADSHII